MRIVSIILMLLGLALLTGLVAWQGLDVVADLFVRAGAQLLWLPAYYLVPLILGTVAWRILFEADERPGFATAANANWIGLAVNSVLPTAQIGGELVRSRIVHKAGVPGRAAVATVVVDKTAQAMMQPLFALIGLALFAYYGGDSDIIVSSLVFIVLLGGGIFGFYRVQKAGIFGGLARFAARPGWLSAAESLSAQAEDVDAAIRTIYRQRKRFLVSCGWRLLFRASLVVEVWLAAHFLGHPMSIVDALILESLTQVVIAAAFVVPGALGVQEGGFMLLGAALGFGPEVGLSLSLARRFRELLLGVPGLLAWQIIEGRGLMGRRPAAAAGTNPGET